MKKVYLIEYNYSAMHEQVENAKEQVTMTYGHIMGNRDAMLNTGGLPPSQYKDKVNECLNLGEVYNYIGEFNLDTPTVVGDTINAYVDEIVIPYKIIPLPIIYLQLILLFG